MSEYCVVVAEGAKARFFTLEPAQLPELESGPNLVEHDAMISAELYSHQPVWADGRKGRNRGTNGSGHTYDEHRQQHDKEISRKFAREVADQVSRITSTNGFRHVVLCAEKQMLGMLRPSISERLNGIDLKEVPKDLAKLSPQALHNRLAGDGVLPRCKKPRNGS